ncbi:MAG: 30S ribosomal protein S17e [Candidatus Aenigmarchaeota archaeon]|nr:30S ribosomal protein S17e [Candidatus Aenigmarchaeota archaeon]
MIGAIKQRYIKGAAKKLVENFPERFSKDFNKNKEVIKELDIVESSHVRNKIAGSVVHVVRNKKF